MKSLTYACVLFLFTFQACTTQEAKPKTPHTASHKQHHTSPSKVGTASTDEANSLPEASNEFEDEFQEEESTRIDPLSGYNKVMTGVNDGLYTYALSPLSTTYAAIFPEPLRIGVSNAFKNLNYPMRVVNNLLQGKFHNAKDETERFLTNSTIGLLGFMDPATTLVHVPEHREDFGQTLGFYGVDPGFHIVLPLFGPSNVRDFIGINVDAYVSPLVNIRGFEKYEIPRNATESAEIFALYKINKTSLELGQYEMLKQDAIELYPFLRDIYEAKRRAEIAE